ncbi:hypothetical protein [Naasia sp. SYSU D00948]|uniref:hypothetical protein n=1 Tax=Naasia sp. SYSU D00948 TaxID=2817379 RepID=UPI001B317896|nr:hypothetical protein [Naasia sp. SYSU D00948]
MAWWRRRPDPGDFPKSDAGKGSLDDFRYDLIPKNGRVTIRLAGSDPHQDLLRPLVGAEEITTAGGQRTVEEEKADAPIQVRLFFERRVIGPVGTVPRGLEAVVLEALSRLEQSGKPTRIPVEVVDTKQGVRVDLLIGKTR